MRVYVGAGQFTRYAVVGLGSNGVLYVTYLVLTTCDFNSKLAMTLIYAIGVLQTFFFNKRWSFRHDGKRGPAFVRYCFSYAFGYIVNLLVLIVLVDHLGYPHQIVQGAMVLSLAVMLFLLQKFWVFRVDAPAATTPGYGS